MVVRDDVVADRSEPLCWNSRLLREAKARYVFLRIAEGFGWHTAVLALFCPDVDAAGRVGEGEGPPATRPGSSLHHIALSLPWDEQEAVTDWYKTLRRDDSVETFDWFGCRGVFTRDPDSNTVALVAKHPGWVAPSDAA